MEHKGRTRWLPELGAPLREVDRLRRTGRYEQALAQIRALAEAHPAQVRVLLEAGLTLAVWGRAPAEALTWFDRVLEMAPGHLTTRLHRALTLARLGRHAEAVADFDAVEAVGHRKLVILYAKRAESLRALERHAEAERDWTQALDEDPGNPWLLQQRAQSRAQLGKLTEAIQDLHGRTGHVSGRARGRGVAPRIEACCAPGWGTRREHGPTSRPGSPPSAREIRPNCWTRCASNSRARLPTQEGRDNRSGGARQETRSSPLRAE